VHGASFKEVIAQLPHKEMGMSNDDCHPRFIACLLRLGDLLDMDDNRFCPVMQRIAGDRPALSLAHEDKHSSIRHFRLDSDRIEISAVCESVDGYVEQWRWLDYLRDEMQCQMGRWQDIAPSAALGLLPTLGEIKVGISGRQLIAQPGKRPEFALNSDRIMKLLKGENLYRKTDSIRELLQNSVDATLLRVWLESKMEGRPIPRTPNIGTRKYFEKYPISVKLEKENLAEHNLLADEVRWKFMLHDKGVGISQEDLNNIMSVGSSSRNSKKQLDIQDMPEWFKPSGTFGIGLQSIFMWTDVVLIETKNLHTQELLNISLHSPSGPKKGLVTIELADKAYLREIGTKLSFTWLAERHPKRFSISSDQEFTSAAFRNHDDMLDGELPLDALNIIDGIKKFSDGSLINVYCELNVPNNTSSFVFENSLPEYFSKNFYSETNSEFLVSINENRKNSIRFRGQMIDEAKLPGHFLINYSLDLYSGGASEYLTFNRNGISSDGKNEIENIILRNIALWAERNMQDTALKNTISLLSKHWEFYEDSEVQENKTIWERISLTLGDCWKELPCVMWTGKSTCKNSTFRNILVEGNFIFLGYDTREIKFFSLGKAEILAGYYRYLKIYTYCASDWCRDPTNGLQYVVGKFGKRESEAKSCVVLKLVKADVNGPRFTVERDALILSIEESISNLEKNVRLLLPVSIFPNHLHLDKIVIGQGFKSTRFCYVLPWIPDIPIPHVLLPFEIFTEKRSRLRATLERYDEFLKLVHSNLNTPTTINVVKDIYGSLVDYIDNDLMKNSICWTEARVKKNN
jgi:hypothetical protein